MDMIRNTSGNIIAMINTVGTCQFLLTPSGTQVAYYQTTNNTTYDKHGTMIGFGNQMMRFVR